jgi:hypothetical protein
MNTLMITALAALLFSTSLMRAGAIRRKARAKKAWHSLLQPIDSRVNHPGVKM